MTCEVTGHRRCLVLTLVSVGWDRCFAFLGYGDDWREHRRLFHQYFNANAVHGYHPKMMREARELLGRLLVSSDGDFMKNLRVWVFCDPGPRALPGTDKHLYSMTAAVILGVVFGMEVQPDDPHVLLAEEALHSLAMVGNPGSYMGKSAILCTYPTSTDHVQWTMYQSVSPTLNRCENT